MTRINIQQGGRQDPKNNDSDWRWFRCLFNRVTSSSLLLTEKGGGPCFLSFFLFYFELWRLIRGATAKSLYKCLFTLSKQRARHWAMRIGDPKSCGAASAARNSKQQQKAATTRETIDDDIVGVILFFVFFFKIRSGEVSRKRDGRFREEEFQSKKNRHCSSSSRVEKKHTAVRRE